ncbi:MAG: DUF3619 family protein [Glaciimonas sp.]|nr:DUF3619 family protein [Glaciimonas sp.]
MNTTKEAKELEFAYKIRHALDQNMANLPDDTAFRLAAARSIALSRKKKDAPLLVAVTQAGLAGYGTRGTADLHAPFAWLRRIGLAMPVIVLIGGLVGIYQFEQQQRIADTADIDTAILTDELPPAAYLDHGFNAYLSDRGE